MVASKRKKKDFVFSPLIVIPIVLAVIVLLFFMLNNKGDVGDSSGDNDLEGFASACTSYARQSLRAEFCKYALVEEELINCGDSRISEFLIADGIDTTLPSLSCRSIDNYSFRKTACETLASGKPTTKIAAGTCADYPR